MKTSLKHFMSATVASIIFFILEISTSGLFNLESKGYLSWLYHQLLTHLPSQLEKKIEISPNSLFISMVHLQSNLSNQVYLGESFQNLDRPTWIASHVFNTSNHKLTNLNCYYSFTTIWIGKYKPRNNWIMFGLIVKFYYYTIK